MKLKVLGNTGLLQYAALSRDKAGVPRLHLQTVERGMSLVEGSGLEGGRYPGPFLTVLPPEDSVIHIEGCEVWVELETAEEHEEFSERFAFISQSKENCYVAFLPILRDEEGVVGVWEAQG
ncbi:MAG TPA: hypothetical protein VJP83_16650 [Terriglobales bacterium]|nr:hypothetical protein [Terriglobales bacterium]